MAYTPKYLKKWTSDYKFEDYYVVITQNRDSKILEKSNFKSAERMLDGAEKALEGDEDYENLVLRLEATDDFVQGTVGYNHWAVGWVEYLLVHKDAPDSVLGTADSIAGSSDPILDDEDYDARQMEAMDTSMRDIGRDITFELEETYVDSGLFTYEEFEPIVDLYIGGNYYDAASRYGHEEGYLSRRGIEILKNGIERELDKIVHRENRVPKEGYEDIVNDNTNKVDYQYLEERGQKKLPMSKRKRRVSSETLDMYATYVGDGYLYGASTDDSAINPGYWQLEEPYTIVILNDVPASLASDLEEQGTTNQVFSDGYEAANAAAPYVGAEVGTFGDDDIDDDEYEWFYTEEGDRYRIDDYGTEVWGKTKSANATIPDFYLPYFEAVLFTEHVLNDDPNSVEDDYLDSEYTVYDIDQASVDEQIRQINAFLKEAKPYFAEALGDEDPYSSRELDMEGVLQNFLLTRNGHGAGFWDGDYEHFKAGLGDTLTKLADKFREVTAYNGDDGKVYITRG